MTYTITSGPERARLTSTFLTARDVGRRYREMVARNATDIVVLRDGERFDPSEAPSPSQRVASMLTIGRRSRTPVRPA